MKTKNFLSMQAINRSNIFVFLLLFCICHVQSAYSESYTLDVGESVTISQSAHGGGYIDNVGLADYIDPHLSFNKNYNGTATITVNSYFDYAATVKLVFIEKYTYLGHTRASTYYKDVVIKCKYQQPTPNKKPTKVSLPERIRIPVYNGGARDYIIPILEPYGAKGTEYYWYSDQGTAVFAARGQSDGSCWVTGRSPGVGRISVVVDDDWTNLIAHAVLEIVDPNNLPPNAVFLPSEIEISIGNHATIEPILVPENTSTSFTWKSDNPDVASVSYGKVTGVKEGTATISVVTANELTAICMVKVVKQNGRDDEEDSGDNHTGIVDGHEYVDLGLSVKWATCNVGASNPEDYGNYYAWGETNTKSTYTWDNYKYNDGDIFNLRYIGDDIKNTSYDVAHANWGTNWRLPTEAEAGELVSKCTFKEHSQNGIDGFLVTGPNGASIFFPKSGVKVKEESRDGCLYWTSCLYSKDDWYASALNILRNKEGIISPSSNSHNFRYFGLPIRAVSSVSSNIDPTKIELPSSKYLKVGEEITMSYTLTPSNANTKLTWSSDNTNIATVSSSGVVKGIKAGTTKIRVKTSNGLSDYCNVTVEESQDEWRDGDIFTAQTIEGVEMTFQVISAKDRTCGVGISEASNDDCSSAIDTTYVGIVTIPKIIRGLNVEKIHFCAFDESNLTAVNIPEGVRELGPYAFAECENLTTLLLPESLEIISRSALRGTGLTSITIPKNVSLIEIDDFEPNFLINNTSLESIVVDKQNGYYDSRNDCNAIIESATGKLISGCKNTIIPSGIKEIGAEAFYGCHSLVTIDIPEGIERIGEFAFGWCTGLLDMTMPSSLVEIDGYAFAQCRNLTMITIPKNVKSFGKNIISGCNNIRSIHSLMMAPTAIDVETIFGNVCYRTVLYVPKDAKEQYRAKEGWNRFKWITSEAHENDGKTFTVKTVEGVDMTFCILSETEKICQVADFVMWDAENNATSKRCVPYATEGVVTIPTKANGYEVVRVNDLAFLNCKWITSVILPSSIAYIGKYALQGCSALEKIEVPNSVESIDEYAFSKCEKLTEAKLPDELTKLESALFWSDKSLSSITLPRTIKDIEYSVFSECESLSEIHAGMIEPCYLPTGSFDDDVYNSATLYVPAGTTDLYKSSRKGSWYRFKHIEEENGNSIADVTMGKKESTQIYKLSGQRVTNPRKGIYIKGGKKVLVK